MSDLLARLKSALAGQYEAESEIGRGGMATVYLARDVKHDRQVALKILHPDLAKSVGTERFLREIGILARLNHPNILGLIDSGEADGLLYYVMPYVEEESLRQRLARESQLPIEDAIQVTREVADALSYAHGLDIVHRDIKPGNILFVAGHAVVSDFGIARAVTEAAGDALTQTGMSVGTPHYMSPEQATGETGADPRSDLYSLGCVLYEMVGGEPPYTGPSSQAVLSRHSQADIPSVSIIRPQTPPHVQAVIEKALSKSPADRFRSAERMREALSGEVAVTTSRSRGVSSIDWKRIAFAVAGVIVVAAAAYTVAQLRPSAEGDDTAGLIEGRIVILPFFEEDSLGKPLDGKSIARLLSLKLLGERYEAAPMPDVLGQVERLCPPGPAERQCGINVAESLKAEYFVYGRVMTLRGDSVQLEATMVSQADTRGLGSMSVTGSQVDPYIVLDDLARQIWVAPSDRTGERVLYESALRTENPEAWIALSDGEEYIAAGNWGAALAAYEKVVEADPDLAFGWYRLAMVRDYAMDVPGALEAAERADALSEQLSERDRRSLAAHRAMIEGDPARAEALYRELLLDYPDDVESLFQVGYIYWAYGRSLGLSMAEATDPLKKGLALYPGNSAAGAYLIWALIAGSGLDESVLAEVDSVAVLYFGKDTGLYETNALRAIRRLDRESLRASLASLRREESPFESVHVAPLLILMGTKLLEVPDLEVIAEHALAVADSANYWRPEALDLLAGVQAGRGKWAEASNAYARRNQLVGSRASVLGTISLTYLASLSPFDPFPVNADSLRSELEAWDPAVEVPRDALGELLSPHDSQVAYERLQHVSRIACQVRGYLLGLLSASEGDYEATRNYASMIEGCEPDILAPTVSGDLAEALRAEVLFRQNRFEDALESLDSIQRRVNYATALRLPIVGLGRETYLRARVLQELEQYDEAQRLYSVVLESANYDLLAPIHLHTGKIREAQGDTARAIWHYESFAELWKDSDPEYQPRVTEVLQHVADLKREAIDATAGGG